MGHGSPRITNVAGGSPKIAACFCAPLRPVEDAVLAKAVDDWPAGMEQGLSHFGVNRGHGMIIVDLAGAAPIVLQVIDSPSRVGVGVLLLMLKAAFVAGAGFRSWRRVDAKLQAFAVDVVAQ